MAWCRRCSAPTAEMYGHPHREPAAPIRMPPPDYFRRTAAWQASVEARRVLEMLCRSVVAVHAGDFPYAASSVRSAGTYAGLAASYLERSEA